MRLWRAVKSLGCGVLREGVYLLPDSEHARSALSVLASEVMAAGGQTHLLEIPTANEEQAAQFRGMFDRSAELGELITDIADVQVRVGKLGPVELRKQVKLLRGRAAALQAIDYFPGEAAEIAAAAMARLEEAVQARLSPGEPHARQGAIARAEPAAYRRRVWATRRDLWIDRIASAWLIQRFIDPKARFVWIDTPSDCPADAVGFDFDGAEFTHVGDKVTFEVLAASFGLDTDVATCRIAALVHCLDVGGLPVPEAPGVERLVMGLKQTSQDDDALFAQGAKLFDALHVSYSHDEDPA